MNRVIARLIVFTGILSYSISSLFAQHRMHWIDYRWLNMNTDCIGPYDLNVIVVGEIELDSLMFCIYFDTCDGSKSEYSSFFYNKTE